MLTLIVQLTIIFLEQNSQSSFSETDKLKSDLTTWESGGVGEGRKWRKNTLGPTLAASAQAFLPVPIFQYHWSESCSQVNF